jgi:hypothetical protein
MTSRLRTLRPNCRGLDLQDLKLQAEVNSSLQKSRSTHMENFPAVADWFQGAGIGLSGSPIVTNPSSSQRLVDPFLNSVRFFVLRVSGTDVRKSFCKQFRAVNRPLTKGEMLLLFGVTKRQNKGLQPLWMRSVSEPS